MKKTLLAVMFTSLLLSSFFVSSVVADDVTITIKGGIGCTVSIHNNESYDINGTINFIYQRVFIYGGANATGSGVLIPGETAIFWFFATGICTVYVEVHAGNHTVIRKGISIFNFVILF